MYRSRLLIINSFKLLRTSDIHLTLQNVVDLKRPTCNGFSLTWPSQIPLVDRGAFSLRQGVRLRVHVSTFPAV